MYSSYICNKTKLANVMRACPIEVRESGQHDTIGLILDLNPKGLFTVQ